MSKYQQNLIELKLNQVNPWGVSKCVDTIPFTSRLVGVARRLAITTSGDSQDRLDTDRQAALGPSISCCTTFLALLPSLRGRTTPASGVCLSWWIFPECRAWHRLIHHSDTEGRVDTARRHRDFSLGLRETASTTIDTPASSRTCSLSAVTYSYKIMKSSQFS